MTDPSTPVTYQVVVDDDSDVSGEGWFGWRKESSWQGGTSFNVPSDWGLSAGNTYYWSVRAKDGAGNEGSWASARSFTIDGTPPSAPSLVSPSDGSTITSLTPTLSWGSVTDPSTPVTYQVVVDDDSDVSGEGWFGWRKESSWQGGTSFDVPSGWGLSAGNTYYWSVRAKDGAGNEGSWASARRFMIDGTPPSAPSLVSPSDGSTITSLTPALSWGSVTDPSTPVTYQVVVDDDSDVSGEGWFGWRKESSWQGGTSFNVPSDWGLSAGNTYYWSVRAKDGAGNEGSWASARSFTVDETPPPTPSLTSPEEQATITFTPTLSWGSVTDPSTPVTYQVVVDDDSDVSGEGWFGWRKESSWQGGTSFVVPSGWGLSAGDTYYWSVRAKDGAGNEGSWASARSFMIDGTPPSAPSLVSPDNEANTASTLTLTWGHVTDSSIPVTYQVVVDDDSDVSGEGWFGWRKESSWQGGTSFNVPSDWGLSAGDTYYWSVRAKDGSGNTSEWSSFRDFIVGGIDITVATNEDNASVYLDRADQGMTTRDWQDGGIYSYKYIIKGVPSGAHTIRVRKPGFPDNILTLDVVSSITVQLGLYKVYEITVTTNEAGASVYLDNVYQSTTSLDWRDLSTHRYKYKIIGVPEGTHTIRVSKSGFFDNTTTLNVTQSTTVELRLFSLTNEITVTTNEDNASVYLDNVYQSTTSLDWRDLSTHRYKYKIIGVPEGTHTIRVSKSGFFDNTLTLDVTSSTTVQLGLFRVYETTEAYLTLSLADDEKGIVREWMGDGWGSSNELEVTIRVQAGNGFEGDVELSASAPSGIEATFVPREGVTVSNNGSELTFHIASGGLGSTATVEANLKIQALSNVSNVKNVIRIMVLDLNDHGLLDEVEYESYVLQRFPQSDVTWDVKSEDVPISIIRDWAEQIRDDGRIDLENKKMMWGWVIEWPKWELVREIEIISNYVRARAGLSAEVEATPTALAELGYGAYVDETGLYASFSAKGELSASLEGSLRLGGEVIAFNDLVKIVTETNLSAEVWAGVMGEIEFELYAGIYGFQFSGGFGAKAGIEAGVELSHTTMVSVADYDLISFGVYSGFQVEFGISLEFKWKLQLMWKDGFAYSYDYRGGIAIGVGASTHSGYFVKIGGKYISDSVQRFVEYRKTIYEVQGHSKPNETAREEGTQTALEIAKKYLDLAFSSVPSDKASDVLAEINGYLTEADRVAPSAPSLSSPSSGATVSTTPALSWGSVTDPSTPVTYQVVVDDDSDIASEGWFGWRKESSWQSDTSFNVPSDWGLSAGDTYYWSVRAKDGASNESSWSSARTFTIY